MKKYLIIALALVASIFMSCTLGMGEALDLEAPVVTIKSHQNGALVRRDITLSGTCTDNIGVTSVTVAVTTGTSNNRTTTEHEATISGEKWTIDLTRIEEGEAVIKVTAHDRAGQSSTKSSRSINLLVDETAPEAKSWVINSKNGIQVELYSLEELKALGGVTAANPNFNITVANKEKPQNESFTLNGRFFDALSIDKIVAYLKDEAGNIVCSKKVEAEDYETKTELQGKSIYSPEFEFTAADLSALGNGEHYLQVGYRSEDDKNMYGVANVNEGTDTDLWLLWYPESDNPGVQIGTETGTEMTLTYGSSLQVDLFDDDVVESYSYTFKDKDGTKIAYDNKSGLTSGNEINVKIDKAAELAAAEYTFEVTVSDGRNTTSKTIKIRIVDASAPLIVVDSNEGYAIDNAVPSLTNGSEFKFKLWSYDTTGSKNIKVAYVSGTADDATLASLFSKTADETAADHSYIVKVYNFLKEKTKEGGWCKEAHEFTYDLINDFSEADRNKDKIFYIQLTDTEDHITTSQLRINADKSKPKITIVSPTNMKVCDYKHEGLVLEYKAEKTSGIAMKEAGYKIVSSSGKTYTTTSVGNKLVKNGSNYKVTFTQEDLAAIAGEFGNNAQITYTFYAEDIIGNSQFDTRTVVLSPLPSLSEIKSDATNGVKHKIGDVIRFQAVFTDTVKVTGTPKLPLDFNGDGTKDEDATYVSGSGSDTLTFSYTVKENDVSSGVTCCGKTTGAGDTAVTNAIVLESGVKIETGVMGEGDAGIVMPSDGKVLNGSTILIDGVKPVLQKAEYSVGRAGTVYKKANELIELKLTFSKNVYISSSPKLKVNIGGNDFNFDFEGLSGKEMSFVHRVVSGDATPANNTPNGELKVNLSNCFDSTNKGYITDEAGNSLTMGSNTATSMGVIIDTVVPVAPGITGIDNNASYNTSKTITITGCEADSKVEYSKNNGAKWEEVSKNAGAYTVTLTAGTHNVCARQTDKAGNVSPVSTVYSIVINDTFPAVTAFNFATPDGNYGKDSEISIKLFFDNKITIPKGTAANSCYALFYQKDITISGASDTNLKKAYIVLPSDISTTDYETKAIEFKYTVGENVEMDGVKLYSVVLPDTFKDAYGNSKSTATTTKITEYAGSSTREGIVLDAVKPVIASTGGYTPANNGVNASANSNFQVTLKFSENIYKESGKIILQRKGAWGIPAVMTETEFLRVYNALLYPTDEIIQNYAAKNSVTEAVAETAIKAMASKIIETEIKNGASNPVLDKYTGSSIGPYKKNTHGLKVENSKYVPDISTKYVLAFDLGLFDDSETAVDIGVKEDGNNLSVKVKDIRAAFEAIGYHQHTVDLSAKYKDGNEYKDYVSVNGNTVTIKFPDTIENGLEWELIVPDGAFRDSTGNTFNGIASGTYTLWSDYVAAPVVRVDRYSHGWGNKYVGSDGTISAGWGTETKYNQMTAYGYSTTAKTKLTAKSGFVSQPTGYVRVRVDSQTPGATIDYCKYNTGTVDSSTGYGIGDEGYTSVNVKGGNGPNSFIFTENGTNLKYTMTKIADPTELSMTLVTNVTKTESQSNGVIFAAGGGDYKTARKDYIIATAKKSTLKGAGGTVNTDSSVGYEGVFTTVVRIYNDQQHTGSATCICGGTSGAGEPGVAGFPLRDGVDFALQSPYNRECYISTESKKDYWYWVSYEIVSTNWAFLPVRNKNNCVNYAKSSYGQATNVYNWEHY